MKGDVINNYAGLVDITQCCLAPSGHTYVHPMSKKNVYRHLSIRSGLQVMETLPKLT